MGICFSFLCRSHCCRSYVGLGAAALCCSNHGAQQRLPHKHRLRRPPAVSCCAGDIRQRAVLLVWGVDINTVDWRHRTGAFYVTCGPSWHQPAYMT